MKAMYVRDRQRDWWEREARNIEQRLTEKEAAMHRDKRNASTVRQRHIER
jgi:hypothetical protein